MKTTVKEISSESKAINKKRVESVKLKTIFIMVNSHKVEMLAGPTTGLEIKEAAIKEGVEIQLNFVLQLEMPNGTGKIIGDDDKLELYDHQNFTAIAPDDNA